MHSDDVLNELELQRKSLKLLYDGKWCILKVFEMIRNCRERKLKQWRLKLRVHSDTIYMKQYLKLQ